MRIKLRVLILGATGFIGSKLSKVLRNRGDSIYIMSRSRVDDSWWICQLPTVEEISGIQTNSERHRFDGINSLRALKLNYFVHAACGLLPSSRSEDFFDEYMMLIEPTFSLIDSCCALDIPFVYLSSAGAIYHDSKSLLNEESELKPTTFYGMSKYIVEQYIYKKQQVGLRYLVLRPTNVYGRDLNNVHDNQGLIENSIISILQSLPLRQYGVSPTARDFLHVDDLISCIVALLDLGELDRVLNIGSGESTFVDGVISTLYSLLNKEPNIEILEGRPFDKSVIAVDIEQVRQLIPYSPMNISEGLRLYLSQIEIGNVVGLT
jgi:nucleoside-diphosphate-sugar epimerase